LWAEKEKSGRRGQGKGGKDKITPSRPSSRRIVKRGEDTLCWRPRSQEEKGGEARPSHIFNFAKKQKALCINKEALGMLGSTGTRKRKKKGVEENHATREKWNFCFVW